MGGILTRLVATHACMITRMPSSIPHGLPSTSMRRSPTREQFENCLSATSAACFSPDHFRCRATRPVGYYAVFKWWLPLSQHPGCLCGPTAFHPLSGQLGALVGGLGCFPFDDGAYPPPSDSRGKHRAVFGVRLTLAFRWEPAVNR